jgi:hypothetical protein
MDGTGDKLIDYGKMHVFPIPVAALSGVLMFLKTLFPVLR